MVNANEAVPSRWEESFFHFPEAPPGRCAFTRCGNALRRKARRDRWHRREGNGLGGRFGVWRACSWRPCEGRRDDSRRVHWSLVVEKNLGTVRSGGLCCSFCRWRCKGVVWLVERSAGPARGSRSGCASCAHPCIAGICALRLVSAGACGALLAAAGGQTEQEFSYDGPVQLCWRECFNGVLRIVVPKRGFDNRRVGTRQVSAFGYRPPASRGRAAEEAVREHVGAAHRIGNSSIVDKRTIVAGKVFRNTPTERLFCLPCRFARKN